LDTERPRSARRKVKSSAKRVEPLTALQASSSAGGDVDSMVSHNDTTESSIPKLHDGNMGGALYAHQMGFRERLQQARKALGLTGEFVGAQVGVSKQTVSHWEAGRYEPGVEQIKALCKVLKVTPNYLFEADDLNLPPDALEEAKIYAALSPQDRRRWRTIRRATFQSTSEHEG